MISGIAVDDGGVTSIGRTELEGDAAPSMLFSEKSWGSDPIIRIH